MDKPTASTTIGLQLEDHLLKGAQLSYKKGGLKVDKLFEISIDPEHLQTAHSDKEYQELQKSLQKALVISTLNTQEVLIRQLEIKLKKNKDIEEVLLFQTEPLLPYPADNAILDYAKIAPTDDGTLLTVLSARKDHLQQHLDLWAKIPVEPEEITAIPAALTAFANACVSSEGSSYLIHLGLEQSTSLLIQGGKLIAAQSIPKGIKNLRDALSSETETPTNFGDVDVSQLNADNHPGLFQAWDTMRLEIKRMIFSLSKQAKGEPIKQVLITGSGALVPHLATLLAQDLEMQQIFPKQEIFSDLTQGQIHSFSIPIGAALIGLPSTADRINFRQGEFAYPHPWKRLKNTLAIYAGLCLALALSFYLFGKAFLSYQEDHIRKSYLELLSIMDKTYDSFEKEYEAKNPHLKPAANGIIKIDQLNDADILDRVEILELELEKTPNLFPLLPNVPRVSDVLAWLNSLHVLLGKKGKGELPNVESIQIESFNYTFVKRPEQNKKQERYQVKVELEFTSPTPKLARQFHDALIAPNDFIDPKGEVKWNSSHGRYRASFFLKDKTVYPSVS